MKQLLQKLHSQSGASMLLALLFLFFCLMVGAVVLTASSANAGRLARNREDQQRYLAAESAALLLRAELEEMTLTGSYDEVTTVTTHTEQILDEAGAPVLDEAGNPLHSTYTTQTFRLAPGPVTLESPVLLASAGETGELTQLRDDFSRLFLANCVPGTALARPPDVMEYAMELETEGFPKVSAMLTVETGDFGRYTVRVTLRAQDTNEMTLTLTPHVATPTASTEVSSAGSVTTTRVTKTTAFRWQSATITKGVPTT